MPINLRLLSKAFDNREKGLQELMELMIESIMQSERRDFLDANPDDKGNGFRQGKSYGNGDVLEFRIHSMIYTTNWIERLQRDFRRVLRMRGAIPNEESVIVLMAKTAMDNTAYRRVLPGIDRDKELFPEEDLNFLDLLHN